MATVLAHFLEDEEPSDQFEMTRQKLKVQAGYRSRSVIRLKFSSRRMNLGINPTEDTVSEIVEVQIIEDLIESQLSNQGVETQS